MEKQDVSRVRQGLDVQHLILDLFSARQERTVLQEPQHALRVPQDSIAAHRLLHLFSATKEHIARREPHIVQAVIQVIYAHQVPQTLPHRQRNVRSVVFARWRHSLHSVLLEHTELNRELLVKLTVAAAVHRHFIVRRDLCSPYHFAQKATGVELERGLPMSTHVQAARM